jgi:hypothetical protein
MRQEPENLQRTEGRSPWEPPTLTLLGTLSDLVRSTQGKGSGPSDADLGARKNVHAG